MFSSKDTYDLLYGSEVYLIGIISLWWIFL